MKREPPVIDHDPDEPPLDGLNKFIEDMQKPATLDDVRDSVLLLRKAVLDLHSDISQNAPQSRESADRKIQLLSDIKYWLQFITGLGIVGLIFYWFGR